MEFTKDSAVSAARTDLADRLRMDEPNIKEVSVTDADLPDSALGAPVADEFAAMMITSGWRIRLAADGEEYEYRADNYQLRLHQFKGKNYLIG